LKEQPPWPVKRQARIPLPRDLFGAERANSEGLDMNDKPTLEDLRSAIDGERPRQLRRRTADRRQAAQRRQQAVLRPPTSAKSSVR
jgi:delta 1-pyrroline-5-carboxylate dehydrogenase